MKLIEQSESKLVFSSRPSLLISWAILAGAVSCWAVIYFTLGSCIVKVLCIVGSILIACRFFEHWRELTFDKLSGNLIYRDDNIFQKLFHSGAVKVVKLRDVKQSNTDTHNDKVLFYCNPSMHVLANFDQDKGSVESYEALIKGFLNLSSQRDAQTEEDHSIGTEGDIDDVKDVEHNSELIETKAVRKSEEDLIKLDSINEHCEENDEKVDDLNDDIEKTFEHLVKEDEDEAVKGDDDKTPKADDDKTPKADDDKTPKADDDKTPKDDDDKSHKADDEETDAIVSAVNSFEKIAEISPGATTNNNITPISSPLISDVSSAVASQQDAVGDSFIKANKENEGDKDDMKNESLNKESDIKESVKDLKFVSGSGDNNKSISIENVQNVIEKVKETVISDVLETENKAVEAVKEETISGLKDGGKVDEQVEAQLKDFVTEEIKTVVEDVKNEAEKITKTYNNNINDKTENIETTQITGKTENVNETKITEKSGENEKAENEKEKVESEGERKGESVINIRGEGEMRIEGRVEGEKVIEGRGEGAGASSDEEFELVSKEEVGGECH